MESLAPQENLITLGNALRQIFPDNTSDFPLFVLHTIFINLKEFRALELPLELIQPYHEVVIWTKGLPSVQGLPLNYLQRPIALQRFMA